MSIVTYRYGARVLAEHDCPDALGDQLVRRTRYWNALVEAEQAFRARIEQYLAGTRERATRRPPASTPNAGAS